MWFALKIDKLTEPQKKTEVFVSMMLPSTDGCEVRYI